MKGEPIAGFQNHMLTIAGYRDRFNETTVELTGRDVRGRMAKGVAVYV